MSFAFDAMNRVKLNSSATERIPKHILISFDFLIRFYRFHKMLRNNIENTFIIFLFRIPKVIDDGTYSYINRLWSEII